MVDMVPVASSNLAAAGYDPETREMTVEFVGGSVYAYSQVEADTYRGLVSSPSPGRYFASQVKNIYPFRRIS